MPGFKAEAAARETAKAQLLAAALARKPRLRPLADEEIPVVKASAARAQIGGSLT